MPNPWDAYPDSAPSTPAAKPWDAYPDSAGGLPDSSTVTIKDGKVTRTHPSKMSDDEIATRILGLSPDQWAKAKGSGAYRIKSMGGKRQVLAEAFTDPEGWWGSYVAGKNKDSLGSSVNQAVQSLFSGANRGLLAGQALVGKLGSEGNQILDEALLRANQANQNINQGRSPGQTGTDPANMVGHGLAQAGMTKGTPTGGGLNRAAAMVPLNFVTGVVATPGTLPERVLTSGVSSLAGPAIDVGIGSIPQVASRLSQKALGLTKQVRDKAASRQALVDSLNAKGGTNLKMTVGQLTDAPWPLKIERIAEDLPFGTTQHRLTQNQEALKMAQGYSGRAKDAMHSTPFSTENDIVNAIMEGGLENGADPARIQALMTNHAGNANQVAEASRQAQLFAAKRQGGALFDDTLRLSGNEPISVDNLLRRIDQMRAEGVSDAVKAELDRIEPGLRSVQLSRGNYNPVTGEAQNVTRSVSTPSVQNRAGGPDLIMGASGPPRNDAGLGVSGGYGEVANNGQTVTRGVDDLLGSARPRTTPLNDGGLGLGGPQVAGSGPRFSATDTRYGSVNRLGSHFGELAATPNAIDAGDSKAFGILSREAKAALTNHAENSGNDALRLAQRNADEFWRNQVVPYDSGNVFADAASTASRDGKEGLLRRMLLGDNDGRQQWFMGAVDPKGAAAGRSFIADEAMAAGQAQGRDIKDAISPAKYASVLENPRLDPLYGGADAAERDALREIMRAVERSGQVATVPETGASNRTWELIGKLGAGLGSAAGIGAAAGGIPGAVGGAAGVMTMGPLARWLFTSKAGKNLLLKDPGAFVNGISPEMSRLISGSAAAPYGGSQPQPVDY